MDQYLSTVIIAIITGLFSLITVIIQKKQDNVINKIDEQTVFIEKEKMLKKELTKKQSEQEALMRQIMILVLDTNMHILRNTQIRGAKIPDEKVFELSDKLKKQFNELDEDIHHISKEYDMLMDLTKDIKKD